MEPISFEFVSVEEAKQILDGAPPTQVEPDWPTLRRPVPPDSLALNITAMRWLMSLPPEARPMELCRRYPRIGNQLAALWPHPTAIRAYLEDLLIDKRGGRQGFPGGIATELSQLQEYLLQGQP
ncbi:MULTISPECIES: hypothetical protein [Cupriavidus]|uniref:Uncharacterized protein n=1 Tax=Cupriavidus pinatubonensis (strain JMP 134 / LMG 1197) TaxID=264198 RepID=Q46RH6_CUPPJ|nr:MULTISPECIES: hypothetical protein [Cupriavidus]QYY28072.1 hypothetical protein K2O51_09180 [Cupriavidus pinatubonensis]TPQ28277.1 hypothetical protein C2U69_33535 [Cupriavidus pinatubonensis]